MNSLHPTLLTYKNEMVISRYRNEYPNSRMSAEEAFSELMKYFWLCQKFASDKDTFLIFTRDYLEFCDNFCNGIFIHHDPLPEKATISKKMYESELNRYLTYIYDNLGEKTLVKWFKV